MAEQAITKAAILDSTMHVVLLTNQKDYELIIIDGGKNRLNSVLWAPPGGVLTQGILP